MLRSVRPLNLSLILVLACDAGPSGPPANGEFATAYNRWTPGAFDTCTAERHNSYSTVGPDGRTYPTWHPPVDEETGCTFGHDHGRDPRGSDIFDEVGDIPFGYANEALVAYDPNTIRHEDHVGHKVEWENDVEMHFDDNVASSVFRVTCDVLTKLHQGTHSADAFTNNVHELAFHIRCSDGSRLSMTVMAAIGDAGEFISSCDRDVHVQAGPPNPLNSPDGGGRRIIPDRACIERHILVSDGERTSYSSGLRESWQVSQSLRAGSGRRLASINPYYQVLHPSRYYDSTAVSFVGRPIDACYEVEANGDRVRNEDLCESATGSGTIPGVTFDDPRSRFNGAQRFVDVNSVTIDNADGPEVWYTDPWGRNGAEEPFTGSIRQLISSVENNRGVRFSGPAIGRDRDYGDAASQVHPPN